MYTIHKLIPENKWGVFHSDIFVIAFDTLEEAQGYIIHQYTGK